MSMKNRIISLLIAAFAIALPVFAQEPEIKADAPDRYTVQRGDTLWSIASHYLEKPWNWPRLWDMNREQVRNPHWIYPGYVLVLDRRSGRLSVDTVRLSPTIRTEQLSEAVPTIPPSAIAAFLSRPMVVGEHELDKMPRVMETEESRSVVGAGNMIYVKGLDKARGASYELYRRGDKLLDPDTGAVVGYVATYLGDAAVRQFGTVSKLEILKSVQEVSVGDSVIPVVKEPPIFAYVPHAPATKVEGRVLGLTDSLFETGALSIISLSRGAKDGLEVGNVLALRRSSSSSRYVLRTSEIWGQVWPTGNTPRRPYVVESLDVRNSPIIAEDRSNTLSDKDLDKIPEDRYGLVMVFRTYDHASFGLVMQASKPVAVDDTFSTP